MTNIFDDVESTLRRRVRASFLLGETKNVESWWDTLPGKRKNKVLDFLGLSKDEKRLFAKLAASTKSEIEAYFLKHKGRVEGTDKFQAFSQILAERKG